MLVISFIGFQNDTIHVSKKNQELDITLREGEMCIRDRRLGGVLKYSDVADRVFRSNLLMIDLHFPRVRCV